MSSSFYVPVDLRHTALLVADVQSQILARFSPETQESYLKNVKHVLDLFRATQKEMSDTPSQTDLYRGVPLIVHHVLPFGINSNSFISPYNKLAFWVKRLAAAGHFKISEADKDPNHPNYAIPASLHPPRGWGSPDEIILSKITAGCFGSSELIQYLRARDVKHVVLIGLTTVGAILGTARGGADLDLHMIVCRDGVIDDDSEVSEVLLDKVLPKFVDVVSMKDIEELFGAGRS